MAEIKYICRCGWEGTLDDVKKVPFGKHPSGRGPEGVRLACPKEGDGHYHDLEKRMSDPGTPIPPHGSGPDNM